MKQRLLTAGLLVLLVAIVFLTKIVMDVSFVFDLLIGMIAILAGIEMSTILSNGNRSNHSYLIYAFPFVCFGVMLLTYKLQLSIVLGVAILALSVLLVGVISYLISIIGKPATDREMRVKKIYTTNSKFAFNKAMNTMFGAIYPSILVGILFLFNHMANFAYVVDLKTTQTSLLSITILVLAFMLPVVSDTFAYLTGKMIGGKKLVPTISENKTIAGSIGGIFWTTLILTVLFVVFNNISSFAMLFQSFGFTWWHFAILGFVGSVMCQLGDLFESLLKRKANMKDSSDILPGHGGILDRIDGMIATNVVVLVFVIIALV